MNNKGIIYAFIAVLLWATLATGFKLVVSKVESYTAAVYIGIFTALFLYIYLVYSGKAAGIITEFKKAPTFYIYTGITGLGIQQILYATGYRMLPAAQVVIIFYLYPLLMILLSALFFKEKISAKSVMFVILGFAGVYLLVSNGSFVKVNFNTGVIITLLASLSWAAFSVLIKHKQFDVSTGMFLFNLSGLVFLILLAPVFGLNFNVSFGELAGMMYLAIFPTAIAFILWNKALHLVKTSVCSNIALLTPVLSVIIIFLVLGECISAIQFVGFSIIIVSVFLNLNYGAIERQQENTPERKR